MRASTTSSVRRDGTSAEQVVLSAAEEARLNERMREDQRLALSRVLDGR